MILNDNKAGMEGLDKESINKIIVDASKGSLYYENEQRKESILKVKIENQRKLLAQITEEQKKIGLKIADELISKLESARGLGRSIVHFDMDAFYAAVEILSKPHLTHVPMAVGSNHMLSTSNYAARKFGVRAGMPGFIGKKLCPNLTIVPLNYPEYERYSRIMHGVLSQYDSKFCSVGLDEAYMDITELVNERMMKVRGEMVMRKKMTMMTKDASAADDDDKFDDDDDEEEDKYDDKDDDDEYKTKIIFSSVAADESQRIFQRSRIAEVLVSEIRQKIFEATGLTSSAGIACNAMLAKVCSDMNKPNGQFVVHSTKTDVMNFIRDLPIRKISGIGKVTEQMLKSLGIEKCSQLIEKRSILQCLYSKCTFGYLIRVGLGIGYDLCDRVDCDRKSLSVERTFEDTDDIAVASNICKNLCQMLADDLNEKKLSAKTITLKIKTMKFEVKTRAKTLQTYTNQFCTIYLCAMSLLKDELGVCVSQSLKIRLMGPNVF
ncbi:hypothetical protein HELRODRAFT_116221 [Helobdella robusta]|uniref:DNA polymerase kappa n=1 Tax=Helobdella robusta TaxID=6412 RepID=T1EGD5_HELRO|nr:hypothetical protein HELRODRAFT_116221 [Helobdella robusta]ESN92079.1 hypothetical protein HELRODRAFT_116221 [Helobdella robusta]